MKARYEAAEASARVNEAMTGAGDEMEDVSRTIERAQQQTEDMEARAAAMDELRETGALENKISDKSDLDRELDQLATDSAVDRELDTLKSEMGKDEQTETESAETETDVPDAEVESELEDLKEEE
jgi:phage shock protein A